MVNFLGIFKKQLNKQIIKNFLFGHLLEHRLSFGGKKNKVNRDMVDFLDFHRYNYVYFNLSKISFYLKKSLKFVEDNSYLGFNTVLINNIYLFRILSSNIYLKSSNFKINLINLFLFFQKEGLILFGREYDPVAIKDLTSSVKGNGGRLRFGKILFNIKPFKLNLIKTKGFKNFKIVRMKKIHSTRLRFFSFTKKYKGNFIFQNIYFPRTFIILNQKISLLKYCFNLGLNTIYFRDTNEALNYPCYYFLGNSRSLLARKFVSFLFFQSFIIGRLKRYIFIFNKIKERRLNRIL